MEGLGLLVGLVSGALPSRGEEVVEEDGCMSVDFLLLHV
jgi:hypothetical protein